ncbi:5837_t:CDS:2 [Funneliformis mosseae]|uniref:non-specific serine/threonine protein kinase n=1 Tax=Funneliformis mosseae TaxID=27381 RepID=A0A9N9GZI5_FUNMO|nr:5837_t:CDS:2 [Funneliformis mosseae]
MTTIIDKIEKDKEDAKREYEGAKKKLEVWEEKWEKKLEDLEEKLDDGKARNEKQEKRWEDKIAELKKEKERLEMNVDDWKNQTINLQNKLVDLGKGEVSTGTKRKWVGDLVTMRNKRLFTFEHINLVDSPSVAAVHRVFPKHQRIANIQCHRPPDLDYIGQPVVLYHEVFSQFLKDCSTIEVDMEICKEVLSFVKVMSEFYTDEKHRQSATTLFYSWLFGEPFQKGPNGSPQNDGYIFGSKIVNGIKIDIPIVIHDMKNEISTGGCDPFLQASICYTKFWAGKWDGKPEHYKAISDTSVCPAFLLCSAGPWLCISDSVKVDNLINMIPIVPTVDYTQLTQIARIFTALRKSFRSLVDYCAKLQPNSYDITSDTKIYFPFPTTFNDVSFTYTLYIKPLILAAKAKNQKIIVKFVQRYNVDAHNLCARENGSPNLLEVQDNVIFGWKIIIMESVNGNPLNMIKDLTIEEKSNIKGYIKHLIDILHENDIVFGDLRSNNVLYDRDSRRIFLIDFDWAGRHNVDKYPPFMNHSDDINWPQGVEEGKLMKKEHDLHFLNTLC